MSSASNWKFFYRVVTRPFGKRVLYTIGLEADLISLPLNPFGGSVALLRVTSLVRKNFKMYSNTVVYYYQSVEILEEKSLRVKYTDT